VAINHELTEERGVVSSRTVRKPAWEEK